MPIDKSEDGFALWRAGMRELSRRPNVSVKISGLGMLDWKWTPDSIRPFVLESIEMFGTDRSMFASNWPADSLYSNFDTLFDSFKQIVGGFSLDEQRCLFHHNRERIYRL
jgi:predicted TIM-barrel fold metal-dependent hydrolase